MDLKSLVRKAQVEVKDKKTVEHRENFATHLAKKYKFEHPRLVLIYTHPELTQLPLSERCKRLNMTEEEFALFSTQKGFRDFLKDYASLALTTTQTQALHKLSDRVATERIITDKYGTREDLTIEKDLTQQLHTSLTPKHGPQVNVQVNNMWEQARQVLRERLQPDE